MPFVSGWGPVAAEAAGWWFFCQGTQLLVADGPPVTVPRGAGPAAFGLAPQSMQQLGTLDGVPCFVGALAAPPEVPPPGCCLVGLRELFGVLPDPLYAVATRAVHVAHWDLASRYCGRCGEPTALAVDERAKQCPACGQRSYPQIAPAVIVAVRRGDRILLARSPRFAPGMFSVLAGFVEPGETLEQCVHREIREEVGIEIGNLRYFGSQPWPFPNSLMLGFTAEYVAGEIMVDRVEVLEADWFPAAGPLPILPGKLSIARALIDNFLAEVIHEGTRRKRRSRGVLG
ncbi:MAG: NAD(+) diphosphatase [Armatimonadetes bacterium]|nr:NAD(+) diphosphatase [Armatimonadota bacterium]